MTACQFLNDHMDNMDNPSDDMVRSHYSLTHSLNQIKCKEF